MYALEVWITDLRISFTYNVLTMLWILRAGWLGRWTALVFLVLGLGRPAHADFAFRKPLTIDGTQVQGGPHLDFPVLVSLVDPDLATVANGGGVQSAQGFDIAFRAADGTTVLDWELERYDGTNGTLVAWVRFPGTAGPPDTRIQNGVSTQFYVYYGDSRITCCQTSHGTVWNAAYREVFHLAGTAGDPLDSTTNGIAGTINPNGDPTATEALGVVSPAPSHLSPIGGGSLDLMAAPTSPPVPFLPTTDSHLRLTDGTLVANASFTLETWFYLDALNAGFVGIVTKNRDSGVDWIGLFKNDAGGGHLLFSGWQCCAAGRPSNLNGPALVAGRWYHAVATYDNATTTRRLYVDGVQVSTDTVGALYTTLTNATRVGDDSNGNYMDGRVDEVRLSTVERSAGWIATGARNQTCASGSLPAPACTAPLPYTTPFLAAGLEEALGGAITESDCCKVALTAVGNTFTVTTSDSQMVWDTTEGAGLSTFTVAEEAQSGVNRRGDVDKYNVFTMQVNDGTWHFERDASGTIQVLESTPTRTRLRQLYDFTGTVHLDRTWSVYAYPRLAIDETLVNTSARTSGAPRACTGKARPPAPTRPWAARSSAPDRPAAPLASGSSPTTRAPTATCSPSCTTTPSSAARAQTASTSSSSSPAPPTPTSPASSSPTCSSPIPSRTGTSTSSTRASPTSLPGARSGSPTPTSTETPTTSASPWAGAGTTRTRTR